MTTDNQVPPITEEDIAEFLIQTPDFFERQAQVLAGVQIISPYGNRTVSLQERQAEMLRDKIKGLEQRIMEMVRNSSDNASIAHKIHRWSCALAKVQDPRQLPGETQQRRHIPPASGEGADLLFIDAVQFFLLVERDQIHQLIAPVFRSRRNRADDCRHPAFDRFRHVQYFFHNPPTFMPVRTVAEFQDWSDAYS